MFDLIVLDLNMPIMSGYQACEKIYEHYKNSNNIFEFNSINDKRSIGIEDMIPVIIGVTASDITIQLLKEAESYGFQNLYMCPLNMEVIKTDIQ